MIEENLSKLGFSPSEIKIYLHLLKNGGSYPNKISAETELNRTNVYEALDRLVSKGVTSFITKNKIKWFEAKSPDSLLSLIKEKEENFRKTKASILEDIKTLNQIKSDKIPLEATIFVGKKGLRMIFEEIIGAKKPISLIAADLQFRKFFGPYFELWHKERIEARIPQRTIFPSKFKGKLDHNSVIKEMIESVKEARKQGAYSVRAVDGRILRRGHELERVLDVLTPKRMRVVGD